MVLNLVRYGLPLAITLAGAVLIAIGGEVNTPMGVTLIGVAVTVALANAFYRLSASSHRDREREDARRERSSRPGGSAGDR